MSIQTKVEELQQINQSSGEGDKVKDDAIAQLSDQLVSLSSRLREIEKKTTIHIESYVPVAFGPESSTCFSNPYLEFFTCLGRYCEAAIAIITVILAHHSLFRTFTHFFFSSASSSSFIIWSCRSSARLPFILVSWLFLYY